MNNNPHVTPDMKALLAWLRKRAKKGSPGSTQQAANEFSISVQAASQRLCALEKRGLVKREIQTVMVAVKSPVYIPVEEEA